MHKPWKLTENIAEAEICGSYAASCRSSRAPQNEQLYTEVLTSDLVKYEDPDNMERRDFLETTERLSDLA